MNVLSISITAAGRQRAARLPYPHQHGDLAAAVRATWGTVDGYVLFCATGIAVRVIAPLLADKAHDPAVVCIDEGCRHVIALCGGHRGGANELARSVAALLGAEAIVTTATDIAGISALDTLPGFVAAGDIAGVTRLMLDGASPIVESTLPWPHPLAVGVGPGRVVITDRSGEGRPLTVVLHPPSLVVGIGSSTDAPPGAAVLLLDEVLGAHGLARESVGLVATVDRRAEHGVVTSLGWPVVSFTTDELAAVSVPNPSEIVAAAIGAPSVAEAAALLAAGPGATLVVPKTKSTTATVAIARRTGPRGAVTLVGLGPGDVRLRTPAAVAAVRHADAVIGYSLYVEQCADLHRVGQEIVSSPIGAEADRCDEALRRAAAGQRVALVCSGDPGVFAMATLVYELAGRHGHPAVEVIPGVTASLAAASILGAPLAHDHALISLSDLLTPWPLIERRIRAVAEADLAVAFYNPRSVRRVTQLERAREILLEHRSGSTPVGIVTDATRAGQRVVTTTLADLDTEDVDMLSIVIVGSSTTRVLDGHLVTPRGYLG